MSRNNPSKEHITVRRTYALLRGAFLKELSMLPLEQITLTEICNTSLVSRSTFYRYFEDKYDLLHYCLLSLIEEVGLTEEVISLQNIDSLKNFLTILIDHISENKIQYQKIYQANKNGDLIRILRKGLRIFSVTNCALQEKRLSCKGPLEIFSSMLGDVFQSIIECYLKEADQFDAETFIENAQFLHPKRFFESILQTPIDTHNQ
ncbi:MAG: hypothetical protein V8S27_04670 [Lachnospiraceae bacterium]